MSVTEISNTTGFSIPRVSMTINAGETLCDKIPFFKLRREGIAKNIFIKIENILLFYLHNKILRCIFTYTKNATHDNCKNHRNLSRT